MLHEISFELHLIEEHFNFIEKQIEAYRNSESKPVYEEDYSEFYFRNDCLPTRLYRGPFILTLYAVYESSVIEIANIIKKKKRLNKSIKNFNGNFLSRSKKYYADILDFDLCKDSENQHVIKHLHLVRNSLAHANGHLEFVKKNLHEDLLALEKKRVGIEFYHNMMIVRSKFTKKALLSVDAIIMDLVKRCDAYINKKV